MELLIRMAGLVLSGLVLANFIAPKCLDYQKGLGNASGLVRQIFWVHAWFIVAIIAGLAALCLGWPELLMEGLLAKVLCGFFTLFWGARVLIQLTYYDKDLRAKERFWDLFFLCVFAFLAFAFGWVFFNS